MRETGETRNKRETWETRKTEGTGGTVEDKGNRVKGEY